MSEKKAVLVESEKVALGALGDALAGKGFEVATVTGGFDALDQVTNEGADVVVAPASLSDLSGYKLACLLKSGDRTSLMPVVLIGADSGGNDRFLAQAAQADKIVAEKELKGEERLAEEISELVDRAREQGWNSERARDAVPASGGVATSDPLASYSAVLGDLLVERLIGRLSRDLMLVTEPRKKFLDHYFQQADRLFAVPLSGIVISGSQNPWAAFRMAMPIARRSFDELFGSVCRELDVKKDISTDLRGELVEDGGKALGHAEILPIKSDRAVLGGLVFAGSQKKPFEAPVRAAMEQLTAHMQPVLKLLLANQEIESLYQREQYRASTDPLTGLYNLEFLVGFLQQQLLFSYRQRAPVGLIIIDIDNFKQVNDEYGYEIGDLVLSTIANRLLNLTRSSDLLARYGGDELAIVLPNTDIGGAKVLGEKVRLEVQQMAFVKSPGRKGPSVTVSVGCAAFNMEDLNPETILRDAKMALQRAKEGGRNRVAS